MILEGANKLNEATDYSIYTVNSATAGQYCVMIPNDTNNTLNMLIDLHQKSLFDEVAKGTKTKDDLINVLNEEYQKTKAKYPYGILIIPMMDNNEFISAVNNVDKQKMFDETKKIGAITSELYKKLTTAGIDKQKINQKIIMIEKKEEDTKFVNWLKEQMPNYVEGVSLEGPEQTTASEPVVSTDIFGVATEEEKKEETTPAVEAPTVETPAPTTGGIFDNVEPVAPVASEPVATPPVIDIPTPTIEENKIPDSNVDIFGIPNEQPVAPTSAPVQSPEPQKEEKAPAAETQPTPQTTETNQTVEAPQPVQNVELEGTTTFSPLPNNTQTPAENETASSETNKKSGGFVNLAILLVILIAVTIVSIELGKFLYSVYGA